MTEKQRVKKLASLDRKIATKQKSKDKNEAKKVASQAKQAGFVNELLTATDLKKIASFTKKNDKEIAKIQRYNEIIREIEAAILTLQQEKAAVLGPV
jgi:GTP cyclohydrolase II